MFKFSEFDFSILFLIFTGAVALLNENRLWSFYKCICFIILSISKLNGSVICSIIFARCSEYSLNFFFHFIIKAVSRIIELCMLYNV